MSTCIKKIFKENIKTVKQHYSYIPKLISTIFSVWCVYMIPRFLSLFRFLIPKG